jgi:tetratricopeptide (TPR) repeat protein
MEYLGDGITESIVNSLSSLPDLNIKACSTVLHYKGRDLDPQKFGRELGVESVLIGRILRFSDDVLIRMELVDVDHGWQRWGEEYKEKISEVPLFPGTIARDISEKLRVKLTSQILPHLSKPLAHNSEAYQFYLQGRYALNTRTKEGYKKAINCFELAIDIDPAFALAYAGLADSYTFFDFYGLTSPQETIPKARAAAIRAVQLDNDLSEAHTSLAAVKLVYDRDAIGAELEFKRAIRLNPKSSHAHDGYAHCLMEMGRLEESLAECKLALELDPLDLEINQHLGLHYLFARQTDRAIEQLQKTIALGPDFYRARILLGIAYGRKNEFRQALAEFLRASYIEKTPVLSGFLGYAYAKAGLPEATEVLDELLQERKHEYVPPYSIALIYTGLGRQDEAFEWLQKAFVEHSHWRGWLSLIPELDGLRSDPRFTELLQHRFKAAHF